jgi:hypothetical protein
MNIFEAIEHTDGHTVLETTDQVAAALILTELRNTKAQVPLSAKDMSDWLIADLRKEYIGQSIENWLPAAVEAMLKELKA